MVYIGTSGYSYDDWVGPFYPEGTAKNRFLDFYAQHFGAVEVNYTYYRMPNARTLGAMSRKTDRHFRFAVKVPGELTHERSGREQAYDEFRAALAPLMDEGKLGCALAQFPYTFRPDEGSRLYLEVFRARMGDIPVVVEFRHAAWVGATTFDLLRGLGLGFCCVDEPRLGGLMPPIAALTSPVGYVRFHGRNRDRWFDHEHAWERYNYLYPEQELAEWLTRIADLTARAEDVYVFFNNHYNAQAVQNAMQFTQMLEQADLR